jgi:hypothetical protein
MGEEDGKASRAPDQSPPGARSLESIHPVHTTNSSQESADRIQECLDEASRISTHVSLGPEPVLVPTLSAVEIPDDVYDRISPGRKMLIVTFLSFSSFLAPISSTTVLAATPEVSAEYNTTGSVINIGNALYMLGMGIAAMFWGPLSQVYGRRPVRDLAP